MPRLRPYQTSDWNDFLALDLENSLAALPQATPGQRSSFCKRWPDYLKTRYQWGESGPSTDGSRLIVCEADDGGYAGHLWLTERV